jgi:hypothetical protein
VDGTPSSGSLDSVVATRNIATPTAKVVDSSTSSTAGNSADASLATPVSATFATNYSGRNSSSLVAPSSTLIRPSATISSKQTTSLNVANSTSRDSVTPSGQMYKSSSRMALDFKHHPGVDSAKPPSAASAAQISRSRLDHPSRLVRPRSAHLSAYPTPTATNPMDAATSTKTAFTLPDLPTNSARPFKKTTVTPPTSSIHHEKATGRSLRKSRSVGGDFEVVSKAELDDDDEFDVLDIEGPSATNGALKYLSGAFRTGWEDDE